MVEQGSENKLEQTLRLAARDPEHRPEFYRTLLSSVVYVLGSVVGGGEGKQQLEAGQQVSIQHWEKPELGPVIPFFSSLVVLRASINSDESYLELPVRALFEITQGATLVLNPRSDYGKEFPPEEIRWLLSDLTSVRRQSKTFSRDTEVLLGQPKVYPQQLVDSLSTLFSKHQSVLRAFVALMQNLDDDTNPHLLIGIDADGDIETVVAAAGSLVTAVLPPGETIDFIRLDQVSKGFADAYCETARQFYSRS